MRTGGNNYGWVWADSLYPEGELNIVFITCIQCLKRTAKNYWGETDNAAWALSGCPGNYFLDGNLSRVLYIVSEDPTCSHAL